MCTAIYAKRPFPSLSTIYPFFQFENRPARTQDKLIRDERWVVYCVIKTLSLLSPKKYSHFIRFDALFITRYKLPQKR